ncbi:MAG: ParB N-terminal domain-containing protein [Lactococcus chungangensis]|nr:ParB N-terminal domain-containing protein [Lactococcus chungangensis]
MAKSKYQNYDTETISRKQIKNAPYNPRIMDKESAKRLKRAIQTHGLVSALTWNKRTGNLVGGHQRLQQLDALEKSDDYELTVCVVDVDEREEAALNVELNNPSMQGEWDLDKLAQLSEDFSLNLTSDLGFTETDVDMMFDGDERFSSLYDTPEATETKDKIDDIRSARKESVEALKERNNINFYAVIVFENEKDREDFFKSISVPKFEEYITADQVRRLSR